MSVYPPPPHAYGQQMSYPSGYGQHRGRPAAQGGYGYPPQPGPSQPVYYDPNSFRRDYASRLAELTINSRPIIQSLSMTAQEYARWSEIVAQCLEAHIRRVPPWMKLPAFYLLDAISKNVYEPYARSFTPFVIGLFLETYHQVDQQTRSKMEEMLLTWRTGGPNGKELFGIGPQTAIERGIWGNNAGHNAFGANQPAQISSTQVLSELEFTLGQKERALQTNPYDTTTQNQVNVLRQLRLLVDNGVSQAELRQILTQLRGLSQTSAPPPPPPRPAQFPQPQPVASTSSAPYPYQGQAHPVPPQGYPPMPPQSYQRPPDFSSLLSNQSVSNAPATGTPSGVAAPPPNLEGLFSALLKAGVVSSNTGTPTGAGATAKAEDTKPESTDPEREASRRYRKQILKHKIKLTSTEIVKQRAPIVEILYGNLSLQCKQCGVRFADSALGKKAFEEHLDVHFRQNRKAQQNVGRGHSRSWFISIEDWIRDAEDYKGKRPADGPRRLTAREAAAAEAVKRDAELRAQFVVVPPGDEAKPISCPICKETLKSEFLEEDEEWVWRNAVKKDDRIFHATCHAEATTSTTLAARLRSEIATTSRSRSGTPETPSSRASPGKKGESMRQSRSPTTDTKLAGTKRKVEVRDSVPPEGHGTPPMKKVALAA